MYKYYPLGENNKDKHYIDEKELYIFYTLLKNGFISSWDKAFTPTNKQDFHTAEEMKDLKVFEQEVNRFYQSAKSKSASPIVASYLLELGNELDEKNFSIYCNADYSLVEGGFLSEYVGNAMYEYLEDTNENRKSAEKYKLLNKEQRDFLGKAKKDKDFDQIKFSNLAHPPMKEYQEAILNKKADKDFIALVNKLITANEEGGWDKKDLKKFIEIYYKHNKEEFKNRIGNLKDRDKTGWIGEDAQTKLAKLIFEHADIHLSIKNAKKLKQDLFEYIDLFITDQLKDWGKAGLTHGFFRSSLLTPQQRVMFGFEKQKEILLKHIKSEYEQYKRKDLEIGSPFIEPEYIGSRERNVKITLSEPNKEEECFLFVHTIIALAKSGCLKITDSYYGTTEMFDMYDRGFLFKIILEDNFFDEIKKEMPELKLASPQAIIPAKNAKTNSPVDLYLNSTGDLWREPKTKYCYPMDEKSERHKIVRHLATNKGYQQTSAISSVLEGKSEPSIRKEINKINENFREFLKIKNDKFIDGKKGSGYRINPQYKISLK